MKTLIARQKGRQHNTSSLKTGFETTRYCISRLPSPRTYKYITIAVRDHLQDHDTCVFNDSLWWRTNSGVDNKKRMFSGTCGCVFV